MRYQLTTSFADFKDAVRAGLRANPKRRIGWHLQYWGCAVLGIAVIVYAALHNFQGRPGSLAAMFGGGLIGVSVGSTIQRAWRLRRLYRAMYQHWESPKMFFEVQGDTLVAGTEGEGEGRFLRPAICRVVEDDRTILLYLARGKFMYVPKSAMPKDALDDLHEWLTLPGAPPSC